MCRTWWISGLVPLLVLLSGCGPGDDPAESSGGGSGATAGTTAQGGSGGGGTGGAPAGGSSGSAGTGGGAGGSGPGPDPNAVITGGPPCNPRSGTALDQAALEPLLNSPDGGLYGNLLVTDAGIFWADTNALYYLPVTGGTPEVAAEGQYWTIWESGADLLLLERGDPLDQRAARRVFQQPISAASEPPVELFSTADGDEILGIDDTHAYVYNPETTALARIARSDGAREELGTGLDVNDPHIDGNYIYYIDGNERVYRVAPPNSSATFLTFPGRSPRGTKPCSSGRGKACIRSRSPAASRPSSPAFRRSLRWARAMSSA